MKVIKSSDVRNWMGAADSPLSEYTHSIGKKSPDVEYVE